MFGESTTRLTPNPQFNHPEMRESISRITAVLATPNSQEQNRIRRNRLRGETGKLVPDQSDAEERTQRTHWKKTNGRKDATAKKLISRPFAEETHMKFASVNPMWHSAWKLCANRRTK